MYFSKKTECILKLRILFNTFQQKLFKRAFKTIMVFTNILKVTLINLNIKHHSHFPS
jgi:hypothetical protein